MNPPQFTEFDLQKNAYAAFDATTLKQLIIDRLNENAVFRDQIYEGSNINSFIDIVAYMYHVLLFYLNTTSAESTFTTAQLYENMNKLVSNIGYKPTGKQTSLATISLSGLSGLSVGAYTLPQFSSVTVDGVTYVALQDINFEKTTGAVEALAIDTNVLHQGNVVEYPLYTGSGENFQVIRIIDSSTIDNADITFIADNTFTVFVKDVQTGKWSQWNEVASLYLEGATSRVYEKRLNENGHFEFKFGDNVSGKALAAGDLVQLYYLRSDGSRGEVSGGILNGGRFVLYNNLTFSQIANDIYTDVTLIQPSQLPFIVPSNEFDSTPIADAETVEDIRQNAPKIFSTQNRLVTRGDYESFISKNFNNIVKSVKALDNATYTSQYLNYFYNIGLNRPNDDIRVLYNQVAFSNSTQFNNVYVFTVPTNSTILNETTPNFTNLSQKQLIINECNLKKDLTHNIVCADPVYKAAAIGVQLVDECECVELREDSRLVIKRDKNSKISTTALKVTIGDFFKNLFQALPLGGIINLTELSNNILNIDGVNSIATRRLESGFEVPRISLILWNPAYPRDDVQVTSQNYSLADFEYAYFYDISNISNYIIIENE